MSDSTGLPSITLGTGQREYRERSDRDYRISRRQAMRAVGAVLYAHRLDDGLIKIGCTEHLYERLLQIGPGELLAIRAGTYADEQIVHRGLVENRAHGREYYHPTPAVLAVVNGWRVDLGMEPVAA